MNFIALSTSFEVTTSTRDSVRDAAASEARARLSRHRSLFSTITPQQAVEIANSSGSEDSGTYDPSETHYEAIE